MKKEMGAGITAGQRVANVPGAEMDIDKIVKGIGSLELRGVAVYFSV